MITIILILVVFAIIMLPILIRMAKRVYRDVCLVWWNEVVKAWNG